MSDDPTYLLSPFRRLAQGRVPEQRPPSIGSRRSSLPTVVGYSRLMGEDEAGAANAVRERREAAQPTVADLGGRIVKSTGDGLLLEFPSIVAAVECAIAIQKLVAERNVGLVEGKRILCRVGVTLGDVLDRATTFSGMASISPRG
jgi:class 3 adenylate cyclase